jgi:hypothetical protein
VSPVCRWETHKSVRAVKRALEVSTENNTEAKLRVSSSAKTERAHDKETHSA